MQAPPRLCAYSEAFTIVRGDDKIPEFPVWLDELLSDLAPYKGIRLSGGSLLRKDMDTVSESWCTCRELSSCRPVVPRRGDARIGGLAPLSVYLAQFSNSSTPMANVYHVWLASSVGLLSTLLAKNNLTRFTGSLVPSIRRILY